MQARRTLAPSQKGAKKFLERYGEQLICVRYRYDEQRRKRFTTVEIIVEESDWSPPERAEIVGMRVEFQETDLQRRVKQAGGKWNSAKRVWEIHYDHAVALDLKKRVEKLEVSDIRHHQGATKSGSLLELRSGMRQMEKAMCCQMAKDKRRLLKAKRSSWEPH